MGLGLAALSPQTLRTRAVMRMHRTYLTTELPAPLEAPLAALERVLYGRGLDAVPIDRPIFVVGCHRSGTTVLYEALAAHPDVACFTNASNLLPQVPLLSNAFCRLCRLDTALIAALRPHSVRASRAPAARPGASRGAAPGHRPACGTRTRR